MYIADLHIHSRFSRATSKEGDPEHLDLWARKKGIHLVGTGDFTHPVWREELKEKLEPAEDGLYRLKKEYRISDGQTPETVEPRFVVTGEISSIYKKYEKTRKVHSLLLLPGLKEAEKLSAKLENIGNIHSDGRPILGLDCQDLLEIMLELCPNGIFIPAHIWTPHFGMLGAFSGFDSMEECFGSLTPYVHAVETGLSSDPSMNWRVSQLDCCQLISNSDAHSPAKLGREASLMDIDLSYTGLERAIQTGEGLYGTIEFFPEEGKYHYDGHRKCHLCLTPAQTREYGGKCPVCGKKLTIGVEHRVEALADRPEGYVPKNAKVFESFMPLPEVIGEAIGVSAASVKVQKQYTEMLLKLGTEFEILREVPMEEIQKHFGSFTAQGIQRLRNKQVQKYPGFDGEYGKIQLFHPSELANTEGQISFLEALGITEKQEEKKPVLLEKALPKSGIEASKSSKIKTEKEAGLPKAALNLQQQKAVQAIDRAVAVLAGPGTGKTKTLIAKIVYLMKDRKVRPSEITAVTFTNKAAQEMKERLKKELGNARSANLVQIGTFHAICQEFLKKQGIEFSIADEILTQELAEEILQKFGLKLSVKKFLEAVSRKKCGQRGLFSENNVRDLETAEPGWQRRREALSEKDMSALETAEPGWQGQNEELSIENREFWVQEGSFCHAHKKKRSEKEMLLESCMEAYQKALREQKALDFDDLLLETLKLLQEGEDLPMQRFHYLLVDEFQDLNLLQYALLQNWTAGGRELFVIGDPDQAIYGFRGADNQCFTRLQKDWPGLQVFSFEENYRSTRQILDSAVSVISKNPGRERNLRAQCKDGRKIRQVKAASELSEAIFVAKEINRQSGGMDMLDAELGFFDGSEKAQRSFSEIGVLYRTRRQAKQLEKCLKQEGIPYVVVGRDDFLLEDLVRGSICFFKSLYQEDSLAKKLALRLLWNFPENPEAERFYEEKKQFYQPMMKKTKPQKVVRSWREALDTEKKEGLQKLEQMALFYKNMGEFLDALSLGEEGDLRRCGGRLYTAEAVTLMTLHASKGLEFPLVFLTGVQKGKLPLERGGSDLEEERRLFYVGMTRAKEELILTYTEEGSAFLEDIPVEFLEEESAGKKKEKDFVEQLNLFDFL